jgi:hypothetical protein|tara:strand:- start:507 stop:713 length:207 start_codon:yes stop_codon:yes gene_type:complete
MINKQYKKQERRIYGDEDLGQKLLVRDISPEDAIGCLGLNAYLVYKLWATMLLNPKLKGALEKRASET